MVDFYKIKIFVSFRTERSGVRNLYILKYQFVNQISRSARNDNQSYFADI